MLLYVTLQREKISIVNRKKSSIRYLFVYKQVAKEFANIDFRKQMEMIL